MHRIDSSTATPDNRFTEGDPTIPVPATTVTAAWLNGVQEELVAILAAAGIAPNKASNVQVVSAILDLIADSTPLAKVGTPGLVMPDGTTISVDTAGRISIRPTMYTCTTAAATAAKELKISGFALTAGVTLLVVFTTVNAAANPTLNVSGTGAKGITYCGVAPEVGQIAKGQVYTLIYSGSQWQIVGGMAPYPIGQYVWFEDELVRPGFKPCNANVVSNFSATYPQMAAYLSTTHGAKRLFASLVEYEAAHNAAWATLADGSQIRWNNIGGAAKFWWDKNADTLLMPDLTGMLREMAGYDSLGVGDVHGDMTRVIVGSVPSVQTQSETASQLGTGAMTLTKTNGGNASGGSTSGTLVINSGRVVPVGNANKPRGWGALACCYLGQPAS